MGQKLSFYRQNFNTCVWSGMFNRYWGQKMNRTRANVLLVFTIFSQSCQLFIFICRNVFTTTNAKNQVSKDLKMCNSGF